MADKQITELPVSAGITNETQIPAYQPGALTPAQKITGAQIAAFAEAQANEAATEAGRAAGKIAGAEAGKTAGAEAGAEAGAAAAAEAGAEAGRTAGAEAGKTAGAEAGKTAGAEAGTAAGKTAGAEAGKTAGATAGAEAGAEAGATAGEQAAGNLQRGATFVPSYDGDSNTLSWTNDLGLPNPDPVELNIDTVSRLATPRSIQTKLSSTAAASFDGSADVTPGVTGVLPIANGGTGAATAAAALDNLGAATRPNLLDNWCFLPGYVVNQRGATDITAGGYGVDRWSNYNGRTSPCSVESDGIHISCDGSMTQGYMQRMPSDDLIGGGQYTLSALYKIVSDTAAGSNRNVALSYGTAGNVTSSRFIPNAEAPIGEWVCSAYTFTAQDTTEALFNVRIRMNTNGATEVVIAAMKLELGDTQTLAHQDEDGNWVLNEYPDYSEQLLRCCMSTADPGDDYANNKRTPAAIGAVNKAGDTMTGNLVISKSSYPSYCGIDTTQNRRFLVEYSSNEAATFLNHKDSSNRSALLLNAETAALNKALELVRTVSGTKTVYTVLHTGNKPTGTYTGNGSSASRTIETGGLGSAIAITSSNGNCIVLENGAFYYIGSSVGGIASGTCKFANGVLTLATTLSQLNANGITYTYQVL